MVYFAGKANNRAGTADAPESTESKPMSYSGTEKELMAWILAQPGISAAIFERAGTDIWMAAVSVRRDEWLSNIDLHNLIECYDEIAAAHRAKEQANDEAHQIWEATVFPEGASDMMEEAWQAYKRGVGTWPPTCGTGEDDDSE
jgi:hypothetical protein